MKTTNYFQQLKGRDMSPPMVWMIALLLICFSSSIGAQTKLNPDNINTTLNYKTGKFKSGSVEVTYKGSGTHYNSSDWNGFTANDFSVNNATITPEKPYIEITFTGYDDDGDNSDQTYSNGFFIKHEGESNWIRIAQIYKSIYDIENRYTESKYGVVVRVGMTKDNNGAEHNRLRYYPAAIDNNKKITSIRFVSYVDYGDGGGNCVPSYANTSRRVDYMFVYEVPIKYDFSSILGRGTFTENAGGEVTFKSSEYSLKSIYTYNNSGTWDTWKKGQHMTQHDLEGHWNPSSTNGTWIEEYANNTTVATGNYDYKFTDKMATGSGTIKNAKYNVARKYRIMHRLSRSFTVGTNGYDVNRMRYVVQTLSYDESLSQLNCVSYPTELTATPLLWDLDMQLNWGVPSDTLNTSGKWYVFRYETEAGTSTRTLLTPNGLAASSRQYTDRDVPKYETEYTYEVSFGLNSWGELSEPEPNLTGKVSNSVSRANIEIKLDTISALEDKGTSAGLALKWTHPKMEKEVTFRVYRREGIDGTFEKIADVNREDDQVLQHTYTDITPSNPCKTYYYKIAATILDKELESNIEGSMIAGGSRVRGVDCTKGTYANMVKVQWNVQQVGEEATRFVVSRRQLGTDGSYSNIYTTQGTASEYYFEDNTAQPGNYYEYKVGAYSMCSGEYLLANEMTDDGFSQATGTISGRITYGTGVAVPDAKVILTQSSESNSKNQFYALRTDAVGAGLHYNLTSEQASEIFGAGKTATIQFYVNPDSLGNNSGSKISTIFATEDVAVNLLSSSTENTFQLQVQHNSTDSTFGSTTATDIHINANEYTQLTLTWKKGTLTFRVTDSDTIISKTVSYTSQKDIHSLRFGGPIFDDYLTTQSFIGYIDEVRVWSGEIDDKTLRGNYNRLLSGSEDGLKIYCPMDEGIRNQATAYDYSKTGGVPNECHGKILLGASPDTNVPEQHQLSLFGLTDTEGNYVIRGVPFSGDGINYVITPLLGIHKFSPAYATRFISANSLNHSAVDFDDISSFPVRGKVYYEHTDYPVEGANLYIDGVICSRNGEAVVTADDGSFEISIPIGDHYIEIRKQGHTFVNNGRYPADPNGLGTLETFETERNNLTFYDNTLVTVAGRVVGGEKESAYPLGLGLSKNNIGKATIKLSPGDNSYRMNVTVGDFSIENGTENLAVTSPTSDVQSTAYRQGKQSTTTSSDDVRYIFIETDPTTGEFAALLPPIAYKIEDINIESNDAVEINATDYGTLDASNPNQVLTDSATLDDGSVKRFEYHVALHVAYRNKPIFTVTDTGNKVGAFGEKTYKHTDALGKETLLTIYEEIENGVNYLFGHPIFMEHSAYSFLLKGYEEYVNKDGNEDVYDRVPLSGTVVTIANQMSNTQEVYVEGENEGQFHGDLKENELALDSVGEATYTFRVGFPNIVGDFTRGLNITYLNNAQTVPWDGNDTFKGIIIGNLPSGSNFVTAGPDKLLMVLRDPPGSNSKSYWEAGTSVTHTETLGGAFKTENEVETVTHFGAAVTTIAGTPGFGVITDVEATADMTVGLHVNSTVVDASTSIVKTTTTQRIETSDDPNYTGAVGDVFIGHSTNILFGKARAVDFMKGQDDKFSIGLQEIMVAGSEFGTAFSYTQYYIEEVLIPNMYAMRNSLIIPVSEGDYSSFVNNTGGVKYISKLSKDDERFGSRNFDTDVWGNNALTDKTKHEGPSYKMVLPSVLEKDKVYTDSVLWYNEQIELWTQILANNEKAKVTAIEDQSTYLDKNVSFDAGVVIENSIELLKGTSELLTSETDILAVIGVETGFSVNELGVSATLRTTTGGSAITEEIDEEETTDARGYVLADDGIDDALTVDVFKAPDNFGPIFSTRGGQTSCPYEGAVVTKYYNPGTTLSAATMQIEIPEITVTNAFATDVPAGGKAMFELHLANLSETGDDVWFDLALIDESNPNGAKLTMDGAVITDGRAIKVAAGKVLVKTVQLEQTDEGVLDYENIRLVLKSQCQGDPTSINDVVADTVALNAYFVPSCSSITLTIEERTLNLLTGDILKMELSDFNRNYRNFRGLRLQYKYANDAEWSLAQEFVLNSEDVTSSNMLLPDGSPIAYDFDMSNTAIYPDGKYTFRVITMCSYGTGMNYNESEEIEVIKDMIRPQVLGSAQPSNGILTAEDDIYVTFNEAIRSGMLTDANNFIITGALNGAKIDHDVALQLHADEDVTAQTEAPITLAGQSFTVDMWINITSAGTILSHGSADEQFTVGVDATGHLVVNINGTEYVSNKVMPMGKWMFLTFNYTYQPNACVLSAAVAHDASNVDLFSGQPVANYAAVGRLTIGQHIEASIHELTLWNTARSTATSQAEMHYSKSAATPNLIGYWKMNEGQGTIAKDVARNRHMQTAGNWALNNKNFAARFAGDSYLALDITTCAARTTDDYALELWFQGDAQKDATIFSISEDMLALRANADGKLALVAKGKETVLGTADYLDGAWHHFALNVLRNGVAIVYLDGENVQQLSATDIPALQSDAIILGATRHSDLGLNSYNAYFKGAIDEVRYWLATLTGKVLADNRNARIDTAHVAGLAAYYPFEVRTRDTYGQWVTSFDTKDVCTGSTAQAVKVQAAASAPGLREAPAVDNLQFSYTASDTQIFIELLDAPARLEGTTVSFTLRNVRDLNNNLMQPIVWTAYVRQNTLVWSEEQIALSTADELGMERQVTITNQGGVTQQWYITHLPAWLNVSQEEGSLRPLASKQLIFTIDPATPYGTYEETIYLTGNDGIYEPLVVTFASSAPAPTWKDDFQSADFEHSMNIIGQLRIDGRVADDTADQLAAFVDGQCVGIASPVYYERYDAYYIFLDIYGNDATISSHVTFRVWDASTGDIYAAIPSEDIHFTPNRLIGSMQEPFIWEAKEQREQAMNLNTGWNWQSLYVQPEDATLGSIFSDTEHVQLVKDQSSFATYHAGAFAGSLNVMSVGSLYKIRSTAPVALAIYGKALTLAEHPLTIVPNWNWIGFHSNVRMSLNDAFAGLVPEEGDVVKGQRGFSTYQGYEWVGTLQALEPGAGYMYQSQAGEEKTFTYPTLTTHNASRMPQYAPSAVHNVFTPVAASKYAGTMTMIAIVMNGEERIMEGEVGVFAGDECRGAIVLNGDGIAFLNIHGEGYGDKLTFKVMTSGELFEVDLNLTFVEDAMHGTMDAPYVILLDGTTALEDVTFESLGDSRIYSPTGAYIGTATDNLPQGVYIVGGKKVFLRHEAK